jgi:hypothetical protein
LLKLHSNIRLVCFDVNIRILPVTTRVMEKIKTISILKTMLREKPDIVVVDIGEIF